jgi:hypothetical protein
VTETTPMANVLVSTKKGIFTDIVLPAGVTTLQHVPYIRLLLKVTNTQSSLDLLTGKLPKFYRIVTESNVPRVAGTE